MICYVFRIQHVAEAHLILRRDGRERALKRLVIFLWQVSADSIRGRRTQLWQRQAALRFQCIVRGSLGTAGIRFLASGFRCVPGAQPRRLLRHRPRSRGAELDAASPEMRQDAQPVHMPDAWFGEGASTQGSRRGRGRLMAVRFLLQSLPHLRC